MTLTREQVYCLIDQERTYQENLGSNPNRTDGRDHTVGEFIVMMQHYYNKMVEGWTMEAGDEEALCNMRKIAGIAVKCMERYGAPSRVK